MTRVIPLLIVAGCLPLGIAARARVDFDHASDFSRYRTYSWTEQPEDQLMNQLMTERLRAFIDEALAAKGLKHVESNGDLLVNYRVELTREDQFTTYADPIGWGWAWGPGWGPPWGWSGAVLTTTVNPIWRGTLVIDIRDAHRNRLIFQGASTTTVSSKPEKNTKRLAKATHEIFEKYPPR